MINNALIAILAVAAILLFLQYRTKTPAAPTSAPAPAPAPVQQRASHTKQSVDVDAMKRQASRLSNENALQKRELNKLKQDVRGMYSLVSQMSKSRQNVAKQQQQIVPPKRNDPTALRPYSSKPNNSQPYQNRQRMSAPASSKTKEISLEKLEDKETNAAMKAWFG